MKRTIELISVVAVALTLTIAFSGVAVAGPPVPPTKGTEIFTLTSDITCSGTVVESQGLSLEIGSGNLLDNPLLAAGEIYGNIKYDENMIGLSGDTEFSTDFNLDTGDTPNLDVMKSIRYTSGELGSLSYVEQVGMKIIAAGKPEEECDDEPGEPDLCPFYPPGPTPIPPIPAVPGSCEEVNAYSAMVVTDVEATTETEIGITKAPVNLHYKIDAEGNGLVAAGVSAFVEDGRCGEDVDVWWGLGSRMTYQGKSIAYGNFEFCKGIWYTSNPP